MDGKYYWLIQNSWGINACDHGFMKIEFGQIGIENVAFSDPRVDPETEAEDIKLMYFKFNELCQIKFSPRYENLEKWENPLEINFRTKDEKSNFNFQCGILYGNYQMRKIVYYFEYRYTLYLKKNRIFIIKNIILWEIIIVSYLMIPF